MMNTPIFTARSNFLWIFRIIYVHPYSPAKLFLHMHILVTFELLSYALHVLNYKHITHRAIYWIETIEKRMYFVDIYDVCLLFGSVNIFRIKHNSVITIRLDIMHLHVIKTKFYDIKCEQQQQQKLSTKTLCLNRVFLPAIRS